jgi:uncharacterized membrane protein HdeD (DUF308 family)
MKASHLVFYVKLLVAFIMLGTGLFFILYPDKFQMLEPPMVIGIGAVFVARGIFRAYSAYKHDFENKPD